MSAIEVKVPDIGDFKNVPVIEIPVKPGDVVKADDPLIVLESDKASMEVPSPAAGKVLEILSKVGDKVSEGSLILKLEAEGARWRDGPAGRACGAPAAGKSRPEPVAVTDLDAGVLTGPAPIIGSTNYPPNIAADFSNVHASPSVRRLARELDTRPDQSFGNGRKGPRHQGGRQEGLSGGGKAAAAAAIRRRRHSRKSRPSTFPNSARSRTSRCRGSRNCPGPFLHRSWLNVPAVTQHDEADITEIEASARNSTTPPRPTRRSPIASRCCPS